MNPWAFLGGLVLAVAAFFYGQHIGEQGAIADQKSTQELVDAVYDKAQKAAASAIADMEIKNVTITQPIRTEVRENVVYRDCKHDDSGMRALNTAITGRAEPPSGLKLPRIDATPTGR